MVRPAPPSFLAATASIPLKLRVLVIPRWTAGLCCSCFLYCPPATLFWCLMAGALLSSVRCYLRVSERLCYLLPNCTACIAVLFRRSLHYLSFMLPIVARRPPCSCVWWLRCLRAAVSVCVSRLYYLLHNRTAALFRRSLHCFVTVLLGNWYRCTIYDNCSNLDATGPLLPALLDFTTALLLH